MGGSLMPDDSTTAAPERILSEWLERTLGGRVVRMERLPRWRPSWAADVERDGEILPLYIKGSRQGFSPPRPVQYEGRIFRILGENGIPTPRQYGFCEEAGAIVMERLPGQIRPAPGEDPQEWQAVLEQYLQALVKMHRLDPQVFADAGIPYPKGTVDLRLSQMNDVEEALYLPKKTRPEPCLEFMRLWMRRNVPMTPLRPSFITGDSFQLIYEKGKMLGFLDLEMGLIGDPMLELAGLTLRSLSEPTDDFGKICRRYAEISGEPLDLEAIFFHVVGTGVMSAEYMVDGLTHPDPRTDYHEYYIYYLGSMRVALEVIADIKGIALERPDMPASNPSLSSVYLDYLRATAQRMPTETEYESYERFKALVQISYAEARDRYGAGLERDYLDECAVFLGPRPENRRQADEALEAWVVSAAEKSDPALIRFFYRHVMRECMLAAVPEVVERNQRFLLNSVAPMMDNYRRAAVSR